MKRIKFIVLVLTLLCAQKVAFAQKILVISDTVSSVGICQYASLFRDKTGSQYLKAIHQTDVMEPAKTAALEVTTQTGRDWVKWAAEEKFVNWLKLCASRKI